MTISQFQKMLATNTHSIDKIEFGVLSAEDIRNMAVCKIDSSDYTGPGTVYDERMGLVDTNIACPTCGMKKDCSGHFGYIELNEHFLHPLFYKTIASFLWCFCKACHRLMMLKEQIELHGLVALSGDSRFNAIYNRIAQNDLCPHCGSTQPNITYKQADSTISMEYKGKKGESKISIIMTVDDVKKIFNDVLDEDVILLGLDPKRMHPRNLILVNLPVIPPCSRPYAMANASICDDDLTKQYRDIVSQNNKLRDLADSKEPSAENKRQKAIQTLKFNISTMMNNSKGKATHPQDNRPLKCFKSRLAGKGGRLRGNLMGKRVNFSARTVIGAEPTLKLHQFGIPREVARIHTKPEFVTAFNIDWLTELVNNGQANLLNTTKIKNGQEYKTRLNLQYATFRKGTELLYDDIIIKDPQISLVKDKKGALIVPSDLFSKQKAIRVLNGDEKLEIGDRLVRAGQWVEDLKYPQKKNITLKIGDVVERHLRNGDYLLVNRQPTLHRGSMLAMEAVIMPYKSFRFNLAATKSFNADFDGDEMNIHTPQSYKAEAELKLLAATPLNIITAQESKPVIVITQDSLVAAYLMTKKDFPLTVSQFSDICLKGELSTGEPVFNIDRIKTIIEVLCQYKKIKLVKATKKRDYTDYDLGAFHHDPSLQMTARQVLNGRGLFSLILPPTLNYEKKNDAHPTEPTVVIKKGVIISGAFDKNILGATHGSLIQILNKEYGWKIAANFIDNVQFFGNAWLLVHGFSVGLEDCMITSDRSIMAIKSTLAQYYTKAQGIEETTQNAGIREIRVTAALSQAKDIGMRIAKDAMRPENNFLTTVISGAKGDFFNIAQLTGLLGQQNLEGHRVMPSLSNNRRTLAHYPFEIKDKEKEYESRGFIRHSFIHGLSPEEFFFHSMSGREGVADTAMGTSKSGYIQRRIVKVCEDIKVQYDGTVRDATGRIYQFVYGNNGYDATKTIRVNGQPHFCDIQRLVDQLNTAHESGELTKIVSLQGPKLKFSLQESKLVQKKAEKRELIERIRKLDSTVKVTEKNTVLELTEILEGLLEAEEDKKDEDEEEDDEENEENEENEDEKEEKEDEENEEKLFDDADLDDDVYLEPDDDEGSDYE